jgi:Protein of unknown function (DUF3276)
MQQDSSVVTSNPRTFGSSYWEVRTVENTYKDEIFTKRVRAGKRTYFFDVKSTKSEKDFYITITESKRIGEEEYEKHKIFLYKEDFEKFRDALSETVEYVRGQLLLTQASEPGVVAEKQL